MSLLDGRGVWNFDPFEPRAARQIQSAPIKSVDSIFDGNLREAYFAAAISSAKGCSMTPYLRLSDREWASIVPHLPRQKSGPRRQHDRETVTAFLFAAASHVTFDCLPDCGFPNPLTLRTTWQRWRASGELAAVMAAGQPAMLRMERKYRQRITDLSLRQRPPKAIGRRSAAMPRRTHVRGT
jgi:hypothetical protein